MTLRFGTPRHGWLPLTLEADGRSLAFDASHTPTDFVAGLIAALSATLDSSAESVARLHEEPHSHDWRFRSDAGRTVFEVVSWPDGRRMVGGGEVRCRVDGPTLAVVLPLWRGLRELASRADAFGAHWREPFPSDALDRLTARIDRLRVR